MAGGSTEFFEKQGPMPVTCEHFSDGAVEAAAAILKQIDISSGLLLRMWI